MDRPATTLPQPPLFGGRPLETKTSEPFLHRHSVLEAVGISSSGFIIVGNSRTAGTMASGTTEAFLWTPRWGVTRLADKVGSAISPIVVLRTRRASPSTVR